MFCWAVAIVNLNARRDPQEITEVTSKHSLLFQETERQLQQLQATADSRHLCLEQRVECLEACLRDGSLRNFLDGSPWLRGQSIVEDCWGSPSEASTAKAPFAQTRNGLQNSALPETSASVLSAHAQELRVLHNLVFELSQRLVKFEACARETASSARPDAGDAPDAVLGEVSQILVRLASVEAQLSSCKAMFEQNAAMSQQSLERHGKRLAQEAAFSERLEVLGRSLGQQRHELREVTAAEEARVRWAAEAELQAAELQREVVTFAARLADCERLAAEAAEVPRLRLRFEEDARAAELREVALSERLEYVLDLANSMSERYSKSIDGIRAEQGKHSSSLEHVKAQDALRAANFEKLQARVGEFGSGLDRASNSIADLQRRLAECNVGMQQLKDAAPAVEGIKKTLSTTVHKLAAVDVQLVSTKEQVRNGEAEMRSLRHILQKTQVDAFGHSSQLQSFSPCT